MRILFVHKEVGFSYGGVESHIKELAKNLALRGHKITILTEKGKSNPLAELKHFENIKVVYIYKSGITNSARQTKISIASKIKKSPFLTKYLRLINASPWLLRTIPWILKHKNEFDVVSVHKFVDGFSMRVVNFITIVPYVTILEGYDFIEAENAKNSKYVITISEHLSDMCEKYHNYEPIVIPIGVNIKKFSDVDRKLILGVRRKFLQKDELLVLNVARLTAFKDIPSMIEAASNVIKKYDKIKFIVCGDGEERDNLKRMISEFNLHDKFFILPIFGNDLLPFYKASDIFLHVPTDVPFNIVYIEAMSASCTIIGSDYEAGPSILDNAAILVEPGRPDLLENAILRLARNSELRRKLSKKSFERSSLFDWEKIIQSYEKVYNEASK